VLTDLRDRIARTRWPDHIAGSGWEYGTDVEYLQALLASWAEFDWRRQETELNRLGHYRVEIDGLRIHFVHERGRGAEPLPIVLTHGFPSSFVEYLDLLPLLTDPAGHGGRSEDAFDVVIQSMPGYGFSDPLTEPFLETTVADLWSRLMREGLGYERFGAHGSDVGSGVTTVVAAAEDDRPYVRKGASWALRQIGKRSDRLRALVLDTVAPCIDSDCRGARWVARDVTKELLEPGHRGLRAG
jgi:microsomal epoxide hydrolase